MADTLLNALARRLDTLTPRAIKLLRELCAHNSFTFNLTGIEENARRIAGLFEELGFVSRRVPSSDPRQASHLVLTRSANRRGPKPIHLLLISHLDTVYSPEEEARHGFVWREQGERIHAPGIVDIKGGTILLYLALTALAAEERSTFDALDLTLALNAAEETGSASFPKLLDELIAQPTQACLIFEHGKELAPGVSTVTHARRGSARLRIDAWGRTAHSGSGHHHGVSAVHALARIVIALEEMSSPELPLTLNVGRFEGGSVVNTVPAHAFCLVDLRADDPQVFASGVARVRALAGESSVRALSDAYACRIEVTPLPGYAPWPVNPASDQLARLAVAAGHTLGQEIRPETRLGASDGCHLWQRVPTLDGLGPLGGAIHCAVEDASAGKQQEYLLRTSLPARALLTATLLRRLAVPVTPDDS